ncbi:MAG: transporter [Candidatus Dadabacteria bacterium]|nr:MAG: transporter [Candidatus Dadabacteria bacterium]
MLWLGAFGQAFAHHGVAALGAAGLEGPGAPIETSSSATLPAGSALLYAKVDHAPFRKYTAARDGETDHFTFWLFGLGYGIRPYLSAYVFVPYTEKVREDGSVRSSGAGDVSLSAVLGLKWDEGLRLVPASESLDDLEDWHFTLYGGLTLPTADANARDRSGNLVPEFSLGFGEPSFTAGATATKTAGARATVVGEASYTYFRDHRHEGGVRNQFGSELRANLALAYRLFESQAKRFRLDANLEGNFLRLGRDRTDGRPERASGGEVLYGTGGVRLYYRRASLAVGVKLPVATSLNESSEQQGSEGKERYRLVATLSLLL